VTTAVQTRASGFFGWNVVAGTFVMAIFAWGLGFHGTAVYVHQVSSGKGWSVGLVSAAVTFHLLVGAVVVTQLPKLFRSYGLPNVVRVGSIALAIGLAGWALAREPWQLFLAAVFSGGGWVALGAVTVNAVVSGWFNQKRPAALSMAYNGASLGGAVVPPLLVALTASMGFDSAVMIVAGAAVLTVWLLAAFVFSKTPAMLGQHIDGGMRHGSRCRARRSGAIGGSRRWRRVWRSLSSPRSDCSPIFSR
jgi:MFS family permease